MNYVRFCLYSAIFLVILSGCGRKTPAIPPGAVIPQSITDLSYALDSEGINLRWTYPHTSVDGLAIDNIRTFLVDKAEIPFADFCSGCPVSYDDTIEVTARGKKSGDTITLHDSKLKTGHYYVYSVRSNSGWRIISQQSNRKTIRRESPLAAPTGVTIDTGDQALTISWQAVTQHQDGSNLASPPMYQLMRSQDGQSFQPISSPIHEQRYRDVGLRNEQRYLYQVYAVQGESGEIRGLASATIEDTPLDMVAPLPPRQLSVVLLAKGAYISWQASPDSDVAGYRIYRRREHEEPLLLGSTESGAISYADSSELQPGLYYYSVSAFDQGSRHNESERPIEKRLTVP